MTPPPEGVSGVAVEGVQAFGEASKRDPAGALRVAMVLGLAAIFAAFVYFAAFHPFPIAQAANGVGDGAVKQSEFKYAIETIREDIRELRSRVDTAIRQGGR